MNLTQYYKQLNKAPWKALRKLWNEQNPRPKNWHMLPNKTKRELIEQRNIDFNNDVKVPVLAQIEIRNMEQMERQYNPVPGDMA